MSRRRPWRARAVVPDPTSPTGGREVGRVAGCSAEGIAFWVQNQRDRGRSVQTWEVLALVEEPVTPAPADAATPVA
jgi:hypothetical protein